MLDVARNEVANHHFIIEQEVKEIKGMLQSMYNADFNEPDLSLGDTSDTLPDGTAYSIEDKKFINIMKEKGKFKNGHHELPLPFRDSNSILPNNKRQAFKRAMYLKKRFQRNEQFYKDYSTFVEDMIKNGYA